MGMIKNCEKCDFNHMCLVKVANHCPFDNPMTYVGEIVFDSPMMRIAEMPNQEAADILRRHLQMLRFPRGCGKSTQTLKLIRAISKGIEALEGSYDI